MARGSEPVHGGGSEVPLAPPKPVMGEPLKGFDLSLLRSGARLAEYRRELGTIKATTHGHIPLEASITTVLEFGRDSGVAEAEKLHSILRTLVSDALGEFTSKELLSVEGKIRLKERIIAAVNLRMTTAKVRQVYFTEFTLVARPA